MHSETADGSRICSERLYKLLADLVAIDSVNPSLVPGGAGEGEMARYVADQLSAAGLEVQVTDAAPGRTNVVGVLRGRGGAGAKSLMLVGHLDTVSTEGMEGPPLAARREGDRVYGRGTCDMKGGLAAILGAVEVLAETKDALAGDLVVAGVADEEYASIGVEHLVRNWRADAGVIAEPTGLDVVVAHKGFAWLEFDVAGKAAHGSRFEDGVDAITHAARLVCAYDDFQRQNLAAVEPELVTRPSLHASLISGGRELSTYPDRCTVSFERRTVPGETQEIVESEAESLLATLRRQIPGFAATAELSFWRPAYEISRKAEVVRELTASITAVTGQAPEYGASSGWMDSAVMGAAGIPTVIFGPSGGGAHAAVEWVDFSSVITSAKVFVNLALRFCGRTES